VEQQAELRQDSIKYLSFASGREFVKNPGQLKLGVNPKIIILRVELLAR
jgi:hypothetical protein